MLSAILNVFILNYPTTHVVCHLECVYSKLPHYTCCLAHLECVYSKLPHEVHAAYTLQMLIGAAAK